MTPQITSFIVVNYVQMFIPKIENNLLISVILVFQHLFFLNKILNLSLMNNKKLLRIESDPFTIQLNSNQYMCINGLLSYLEPLTTYIL